MLVSLLALLMLSARLQDHAPDARASEPPSVARADALALAGQWQAAADAYRRVLAADPADGRSAAGLANVLFELHDWRAAADAFAHTAEVCPPERADALYGRARALARLGETEAGLLSLRQALSAGYLATRTLASDRDLDALRTLPGFTELCRGVFGPVYGEPTPTRPPTALEMAAGVRLLVDTILARHPDPFRNLSRADWEARVTAARARAERWNEAEYLVELMRLASSVGDVHTSAYPGPDSAVMQRALPLAFWKFPDGLRIRAAKPEHAELLGAEVLTIGGAGLSELWPRLVREFPYENEWMAAGELAFFLRFPDFVRGLGLVAEPGVLRLGLRLAGGNERVVDVPALERSYEVEAQQVRGFLLPPGWLEAGAELKPAWLARRGANYWFEVLPESHAVYLQFNLPRDDAAHPWTAFLDELVAAVRREHVERLVIDLRHNPGGWGYMAKDLGWRLRELPEVNRPGHLFVLIGRVTQSAGVVIAAELERNAHAVFVGEPLAAHPNFFNGRRGNHPPLCLPGTGLRFRVAEVEEQQSDPLDPRRFIAPDIRAPLTWDDLSIGRDPALEAALDTEPAAAARLLDDAGGRALEPYFRWERPSQYWAWGRAEDHPLP
ncbi:MAG: hypothetical protein EXS08_14945 [Planctomycetes bacterium]|nr:hypothetical protein [Planctomycetota bacterium]